MSTKPIEPQSVARQPSVDSQSEQGPRLWLPIAIAVVYWIFYFGGGKLGLDLGTLFFSRLGASGLVFLLGSIWWWLNSRIPLRDRALPCVVFIVGLVATPLLFAHKSIDGFGMYLFGIPVVFSAALLGLIAARNSSHTARRYLVAGLIIAAFLGFSLVRMEGVSGNGDAAFAWRWSPTAEEVFLSQQADAAQSQPSEVSNDVLVAAPGDWTEFRGADRGGVVQAGDVLTDWRTHRPEVRWKKPVGPAWSSLIVVADRVFTQEQRGKQEAVVCYEAGTGNEVWSRAYEARYEDSVSGAGPRATPTFVNGRIYALGAAGQLVCLDASTGDLLWQRKTLEDSTGEQQMWGYSSSPLIVDDLVIVFAGGEAGKSLLAYQIVDGTLAWSADAGKTSFSSPQLATLGGSCAIVFTGALGVQAFEPASGKLKWQWGEQRPNETHSLQPHVTSAAERGERLYVVTAAGTSEAKVTTVNDEQLVETGWLSKDLKPDFNDFVIFENHAYGFDREIFTCINLETGKRTWKGGRYGHGQVILLDDKARLLILGEQGQAVLLAANPQKHEELGRFQALQGKTWNHPVVVGRRLYLRNAEEMACYELARQP